MNSAIGTKTVNKSTVRREAIAVFYHAKIQPHAGTEGNHSWGSVTSSVVLLCPQIGDRSTISKLSSGTDKGQTGHFFLSHMYTCTSFKTLSVGPRFLPNL